MTNLELELLSTRVHQLRRWCQERGVDLSDRHHTEFHTEARDLAHALGAVWWPMAANPFIPLELLGLDGETEAELLPRLAARFAG
jgi:hypothetical protein